MTAEPEFEPGEWAKEPSEPYVVLTFWNATPEQADALMDAAVNAAFTAAEDMPVDVDAWGRLGPNATRRDVVVGEP